MWQTEEGIVLTNPPHPRLILFVLSHAMVLWEATSAAALAASESRPTHQL